MTYLTWLLFPLALLAWIAVGLFAWTIQGDEADRLLRTQTIQESESREATALRLHSIVQDTESERAQLDSLVTVDVVSVVDMLEETGKAAGVKVTVINVLPEGVAAIGAGNANIVATGFVIEAHGRFSALMHVLQLLETLPIPSTLGRLDIELVPNPSGSSSTWGMNAYIRVLTAEEVSS